MQIIPLSQQIEIQNKNSRICKKINCSLCGAAIKKHEWYVIFNNLWNFHVSFEQDAHKTCFDFYKKTVVFWHCLKIKTAAIHNYEL